MICCPRCNSENIKKNGFQIYNGYQKYKCKDCLKEFNENTIYKDSELIKENVRLAKKEQTQRDLNRIERKSFREYARIENAIEEYNKKLIEVIQDKSFNISTIKHKSNINSVSLLVQLSDLHLNELVKISGNSYDFYVAAKRLKKYAEKIINYAKAYNINEIVVAMTGDLLNSDRRLDELLSKATNRSKATFITVDLLQQFLIDLNSISNISVVAVTGNESRVKEEMGYTNIVATDNYDYTIFNILKLFFKNKNGINFIDSDPTESIIRIGEINILITHGFDVPNSGTQKFIQQLIGRYAQKKILIDYIIFGHLHSAFLSDYFSRSSSLIGSNSYNENSLNLGSKASQNIYFIYKKDIDAVKIDLQDVKNIKGYEFEDLGDIYNIKSDSKINSSKKKVVFEVVI